VREYETTVIVQPEISSEGTEAILQKMDGVLERGSSTRLMCSDLGKRKLAYEIKKFQKGHYYVLSFIDQGQVIRELERALRLEESVLRFMTIQVDDDVADIEARQSEAHEQEIEQQKRAAEKAAREAEEAKARAEVEAQAAEEAKARAAAEAKAAEEARLRGETAGEEGEEAKEGVEATEGKEANTGEDAKEGGEGEGDDTKAAVSPSADAEDTASVPEPSEAQADEADGADGEKS
jgi:small subunit ribosomal protein S6